MAMYSHSVAIVLREYLPAVPFRAGLFADVGEKAVSSPTADARGTRRLRVSRRQDGKAPCHMKPTYCLQQIIAIS